MNTKSSLPSGPVYSTEFGRMCPTCLKAIKSCSCQKDLKTKTLAPTDGIVRIRLETKARKGKGVTVIQGLPLNDTALVELGKKLKQKCGSGGTVKHGLIEVQGDHRSIIIEELTRLGYTVKRAGGS